MNLEVRVLAPDETVILPQPLQDASGFVGLDPWLKFVNDIYDHPFYRIVAQTGDQATGLLALTHVKHPIFGSYLVTAPFGSYGGFAFASIEVRDALLVQARVLVEKLGVDYVNVRFDSGDMAPPAGWLQYPAYATYRVQLRPDPEELMSLYSPNHRNHIRKSMRKGFVIRFGRLNLLDDVYEVLTRSMHELGSPYHSRDYLRCMAESLGEMLEFAVLSNSRGELAGAGVFIFQGNVVTNLHANILRRFRLDYAGEFLYWSVITRYSQKGFQIFDMGRSMIGSGNENFKIKWKPTKYSLAYWYALRDQRSLPELNQGNPKLKIAASVWKRLPEFAIRFLGPSLIRGVA